MIESISTLFKYFFVDFIPNFGTIPENWSLGVLSDLVTIKYGKDHKYLFEGTITVYGSGGLMRKVDKSIIAMNQL